jgi:adenylate cyclase
MGDGMLLLFASAVDAVRGAIEVQRSMSSQNADVRKMSELNSASAFTVGDMPIPEPKSRPDSLAGPA